MALALLTKLKFPYAIKLSSYLIGQVADVKYLVAFLKVHVYINLFHYTINRFLQILGLRFSIYDQLLKFQSTIL